MEAGAGPDTLRIEVLEGPAEGGVFAVRVRCGDPALLAFWARRAPFRNGQVEQVGARRLAGEGGALEFRLRAPHRLPRLPNGHYCRPFVVALCLDALSCRYRLAPGTGPDDGGENTLVLLRPGRPASSA